MRELPECPIRTAFLVVGDKWRFLILQKLIQGKLRFGKLKESIPDISEKMLSQSLRSMEADGLIHREYYAQIPPKVEYSLTALGRSLSPVLSSLYDWGKMYQKYCHDKGDDIIG